MKTRSKGAGRAPNRKSGGGRRGGRARKITRETISTFEIRDGDLIREKEAAGLLGITPEGLRSRRMRKSSSCPPYIQHERHHTVWYVKPWIKPWLLDGYIDPRDESDPPPSSNS
jgi:hypothetical protein